MSHDQSLTTREHLLADQQPITLRRCLSCDAWLRSTGADHRICNECKEWKQNPERYWNGGRVK